MEITTEENRISIDGVSYPKDGFYVKPISKGVSLVAMSKSWSIKILVDDTTIDGSPVADRDELMTFFNEQGFKSGGTGPGTESVQSVTGDGVDNTDPLNPVVNQSTWATIEGKPAFVAEGADQATARESIGAGTSNLEIGTTATTAMAGDTPIPTPSTWGNIAGKPAFVAEGADAAAARTALGLGTAATTDSSAYATEAQGALASSAVQPATLDSRLSAAQRSAIDALVSPETDYADMAEATAAIKSIIDALKAT